MDLGAKDIKLEHIKIEDVEIEDYPKSFRLNHIKKKNRRNTPNTTYLRPLQQVIHNEAQCADAPENPHGRKTPQL